MTSQLEELLELARNLFATQPNHECDEYSTDRRCLTCAVDDQHNCYECGESDEDLDVDLCTRCLRSICYADREIHVVTKCTNERTI